MFSERAQQTLILVFLAFMASRATYAGTDFTLNLSDEVGGVDEAVAVTLDFINDSDGDIVGYQWGVCHDDLVSVSEGNVDNGSAVDDVSFTFHSVEYHEDGWAVGALTNVLAVEYFPRGNDHEMYHTTYQLLEAGTSSIEFCETLTLDSLEVTVRIFADADEVEPGVGNGSIEIDDPEFLRGDVDGNGEVDALPDAVALLGWAFLEEESPSCLDSADVDDNGVLYPLLDALYLLQWGFADGDDPPIPGTQDCGTDPTIGDTNCESAPDCS